MPVFLLYSYFLEPNISFYKSYNKIFKKLHYNYFLIGDKGRRKK